MHFNGRNNLHCFYHIQQGTEPTILGVESRTRTGVYSENFEKNPLLAPSKRVPSSISPYLSSFPTLKMLLHVQFCGAFCTGHVISHSDAFIWVTVLTYMQNKAVVSKYKGLKLFQLTVIATFNAPLALGVC